MADIHSLTLPRPSLFPNIVVRAAKTADVSRPNGDNKEKAATTYDLVRLSLGGGASGAGAMACQVTGLMWMRTVMNYQYRYGGGHFFHVLRTLWSEGGLVRLYRGYGQAMAQAPLARFGDAAANQGVLVAPALADLPMAAKTAIASTLAAFWRLNLMPIDAWKTVKQVEGKHGTRILLAKVKSHGIGVLYHGMGATFAATLVGHYPWFVTYNYLSQHLPKPTLPPSQSLTDSGTVHTSIISLSPTSAYRVRSLGRQALIGFTASVISDTVTNSLRVIKTVKQTTQHSITYAQTVRSILADDGGRLYGLFFRGLGTRLAVNGIQGLTFSVLWKVFMDSMTTTTAKS